MSTLQDELPTPVAAPAQQERADDDPNTLVATVDAAAPPATEVDVAAAPPRPAELAAADEPDEKTWSLKRILALAKPEWKPLTIGTFFLAISALMGLAYPKAIGLIIDAASGASGATMIDTAAIAMGVIFLIQGVATALRSYLFTVAGERIVTRLRQRLYARIMAQDVAFFDTRRTGELLNRLSADTTVLQNTVSVNVSMGLRHVAAAFGGIILLLVTSPSLTAIMLAVVPPVVLASIVFGRKLRRLSRDVQDALAKASEVAEETISGVRTVRAFAREDAEVTRYSGSVEHSFELAKKRAGLSASFFGAVSFAGYASVALVLWSGGHMVVDEVMSVGELTSFVLYTLIVAFSIGALGGLWADFMKASGAAQRVFSLIDRAPTMVAGAGLRPDALEGQVELRDVRFHYPSRPDVRVLDGLDLTLEPGRVVALVGPSGGGKSTIASLIARLYDPDGGEVRIGGHDARELDPEWLREQIGTVAQEPILFSTTVAENIRYGRLDASQADIERAARAAYADDFIRAFPDGYDTRVGERGVQLSGGQKQRVAIARAVLKDPRILILDEATSALDAESEAVVQAALDDLMQGRTTMVIAHRLSTVRDADEVAVIDGGRVVEHGNHDALMAREDGLYRKLVERQLS